MHRKEAENMLAVNVPRKALIEMSPEPVGEMPFMMNFMEFPPDTIQSAAPDKAGYVTSVYSTSTNDVLDYNNDD